MANDTIYYEGTILGAPILPGSSIDKFETHRSEFGKGGWHEVATLADRDAITDPRLSVGMAVYVISDGKTYILDSLDTSTTPSTKTWHEYKPGQGNYIRKVAVLPTTALSEDEIVQFVGNSTEDFINGYFYKSQVVITPSNVDTIYTGITLINVETDLDTFESYFDPQTSMVVYFNYVEDQTNPGNGIWTYLDEPVADNDLSVFGVSYDGEPEIGDSIEVDYTEEIQENKWVRIDVQPTETEHLQELIDEHNEDRSAHAVIVESLTSSINTLDESKQDKLQVGSNIEIDPDTNEISAIVPQVITDYDDLTDKPAIDGVTLTSTTTKADLGLGSILVFKGTVADLTALANIQNPSIGDTYYVTAENGQYSWNGTTWDPTGSGINISIDDTLKGTGSQADPIGISDKTEAALIVPDTSTMEVVETHEFDMSSTGYYRFASLANTFTTLSSLNKTAIFRITITGNNINSEIEGVIALRQRVAEVPYVVLRHKSGTKTAANTGTRYIRLVYPKALNNNGDWAFDLRPYNATARHVKVEVLKTDTGFDWNHGEIGTYTSTLQSVTNMTLYTTDGLIGSSTLNWNTNTSTSAGYITSYLPKLVSGGTMPLCAEQVAAYSLLYLSGNKIYPASNLITPIDPDFGIQLTMVTTKANAAIAYTSLRQKEALTSLSQIPHGTLTRGDSCYFRCRMENGHIYSDNYVSTTMDPGYTWYYIGVASSSTAINIDTTQSLFISIDANGDLERINGKALNSYTKEEVDDKIELLQAGSDVRDIVGTYQDLLNYPTENLINGDVIEILEDEEHDGTATYYRWVIDVENPQGHWVYVGERGPYYTKRQTTNLIRDAVAAEAAIRESDDKELDAKIAGLAKYGLHETYPLNIPAPENAEEGLLLFIENPGITYKGEIVLSELPVNPTEGDYYLVDSTTYYLYHNDDWVQIPYIETSIRLSSNYDLYIDSRTVSYYAYNLSATSYRPYGSSIVYLQDKNTEYQTVKILSPEGTLMNSASVVYAKSNLLSQIASIVAPYAYLDENENLCYWTEDPAESGTSLDLPSMRDNNHEVIYFYDDEEETYNSYLITDVDLTTHTVTDSEGHVYTRHSEDDKLYSCFDYDGNKIWVKGDPTDPSFDPVAATVYEYNGTVLIPNDMIVESYDSTTQSITIEDGDTYTYTNNPKTLDLFSCVGIYERNSDIFTMTWAPLSNYGAGVDATYDAQTKTIIFA